MMLFSGLRINVLKNLTRRMSQCLIFMHSLLSTVDELMKVPERPVEGLGKLSQSFHLHFTRNSKK